MLKRTLVGTLLGAVSIALIIWGVVPLFAEVLFIAFFGINEFYDMAVRKGIRPSRSLGVAVVIALTIFPLFGREEYMSVLLLGVCMISMLAYIFRRGFHVSSFLDVGVTILGFIYVGAFFSYILFIRQIEGAPFNLFGFNIERGAGFVLLLVFSTFFNDVGAYFIGSFFGKNKLCPHISPKKTVEGSIGGLFGSIMGALLIGTLLKISESDLIAIGLLCGIFAQLGDLWASILKRDVEVKDAGSVFGSHGGALDRVDSLLFTSSIIYFYLIYFYR